jgi:hypothetical protein
LDVAGEVPYSEDLVKWNLSDKSVFEFDNAGIKERIGGILEKISESDNVDRACKREV